MHITFNRDRFTRNVAAPVVLLGAMVASAIWPTFEANATSTSSPDPTVGIGTPTSTVWPSPDPTIFFEDGSWRDADGNTGQFAFCENEDDTGCIWVDDGWYIWVPEDVFTDADSATAVLAEPSFTG